MFSVRTQSDPRRAPVLWTLRAHIRRHRRHGSELAAELIQEIMEYLERAVGRSHLAKLAKRRLKIVGNHRQIENAVDRSRLLQRGAYAFRIRSAVKHIIAIEIRACTEMRHEHGRNVCCLDRRASMIGNLHAATSFRE